MYHHSRGTSMEVVLSLYGQVNNHKKIFTTRILILTFVEHHIVVYTMLRSLHFITLALNLVKG